MTDPRHRVEPEHDVAAAEATPPKDKESPLVDMQSPEMDLAVPPMEFVELEELTLATPEVELVGEDEELNIVRPQYRSPADATPSIPRVSWKVVQLVFDGVDPRGFGHAYDPTTRDEFLLNRSTVGFDPSALQKGMQFRANVTRAHYVERIEKVGPASVR